MTASPLRRRLITLAIIAPYALMSSLGAYAVRQAHLADTRRMPPGVVGTPTAVANQYVRRGVPFVAREPDGLTLVCVASANAETLEPMALAVEPTPTPGAVFNYAYSGPGGYGGASGYSP